MSLDLVLARIDQDLPKATERLFELLRIPSISTDPAYEHQCDLAADWLVADLASIGIKASKRLTSGHPMVVGRSGESGPHVLFYGHYDVQPVDPLDLWDRDPFDPVLESTAKGQVIRGRGSSDDKGQLMTFVRLAAPGQQFMGTCLVGSLSFLRARKSPDRAPPGKTNRENGTRDVARPSQLPQIPILGK